MTAGRPTDYNSEISERICEWIAGGRSLRAFCRDFPDAPDLSTITRWIVRHDEFRKQYVQARESAGYAHADSIVSVVESLRDEGLDPQAARAMIDGLKWAAERMAPKTHSPRQDIAHSSPDGSMSPTRIVIEAASVNSDDSTTA